MYTFIQKSLRHSRTAAAVAGLMALGLLAASCSKTPGNASATGEDMTKGSSDAKITLVEYASVGCPLCATFNTTVMPELEKKYIDTGKVHYVYRPMLTGSPGVASAGELLAECAGKDKYFKVVDAIMKAQPEIYANGENDTLARPILLRIANSFGMSEADFNTCIMNEKGLKRLNDLHQQYVEKDGVDGTPTFFVNGKKLTRTAGDITDFDKAFEPLLSSK